MNEVRHDGASGEDQQADEHPLQIWVFRHECGLPQGSEQVICSLREG